MVTSERVLTENRKKETFLGAGNVLPLIRSGDTVNTLGCAVKFSTIYVFYCIYAIPQQLNSGPVEGNAEPDLVSLGES